MTRQVVVLRTDPVRPDGQALDRAAEVLSEGGLVVAPTETRYGLLARADRQDILEKLYELKRRSIDRPTALLIDEFAEASQYGRLNQTAAALAARFWPGPLTLVLAATENWPPPRVVAGKIGLRCSSAPVIRDLLNRVDMPVTATSANISGRTDHDRVEGIVGDFQAAVALYLDGGPLTGPVSTVVDCTEDRPRVLREGAVTSEEIARVTDELYD